MSFISPCVLPLIPGYLSFVSGVTLDEMRGSWAAASRLPARRRRAVIMSLAFVLGFSLVFVSLGASATAIGSLLMEHLSLLGKIAGIVIILFGLHMMGVLKIGWLYNEKRDADVAKPAGFFGAMLVGVAFAFGWTPCIGPILAAILAVAATQESVGEGVKLLAVYSAGLGVPFIATSLAINKFLRRLCPHPQALPHDRSRLGRPARGRRGADLHQPLHGHRPVAHAVLADLLKSAVASEDRLYYCARLCYIRSLDEFATDTRSDSSSSASPSAFPQVIFSTTSTRDLRCTARRQTWCASRRRALATIADVRAGQFAYVARGQGEAFWMSRVESLLPALQERSAEFGASLASPAAQSAFEPASAALENFRTLDTKVRELTCNRQLAARGGHDFFRRPRIDCDGL